MPLRLTRAGLAPLTGAELDDLRAAFDRQHCLHLRGFLEPRLLAWLQGQLRAARFVTRVHEALDPPAVDEAMDDPRLHAALFMLTNDRALFAAVEHIARCDRIGCYVPLISRQDPAGGHRDTWHGDVDGNRLVALSVNVGGRFEGGTLQIRQKEDERLLHEARNDEPGDALLFRIAPSLQHRVAPLLGTAPRTVLVGWFQRAPRATAAWPATLEWPIINGQWPMINDQ